LAFLPQFIPINEAAPLKLMFTMSVIFMALTLIIFLIYGATASRFRDYVIASPVLAQWIQRFFAVAFAAFGLKLALLV
jgi:threonine/homoserine/homoserine lactone efflux protein